METLQGLLGLNSRQKFDIFDMLMFSSARQTPFQNFILNPVELKRAPN